MPELPKADPKADDPKIGKAIASDYGMSITWDGERAHYYVHTLDGYWREVPREVFLDAKALRAPGLSGLSGSVHEIACAIREEE